MNKVALYCRPGFEKECAAEITDKAGQIGVYGFSRVKEGSGYVILNAIKKVMQIKLLVMWILEGLSLHANYLFVVNY